MAATAVQNGELATKYRAEISELLLMIGRLNEGDSLLISVGKQLITERIIQQPTQTDPGAAREQAKLNQTQAAGLAAYRPRLRATKHGQAMNSR